MKQMKKILSLVLALVMVAALSVNAFAADGDFTITVPAADTHTYDAYQIFTGDYSDGKLSNLKWGANADLPDGKNVGDAVPKSVVDALTAVAGGSDSAKLDVIKNYVDLSGTAFKQLANGANNDIPAGYYLVKDRNFPTSGADDAATTYIVQVVDNVTIARKAAKPTIDKLVHDEEGDAETGHTNGWGETADHHIGETFQYKLVATLPNEADLDAYKTYKLVFNDEMSDGVTFLGGISVVAKKGSTTATITDYTTEGATMNGAGISWSLTIANLKSYFADGDIKGVVVEVTYNAKLNENCAIGNHDTNKNSVSLDFSNNPNVGGSGDTGHTGPDHVWVFTYEMPNTKYYDEATAGKELEGAGFKLKANSTGEWAVMAAIMSGENVTGYRITGWAANENGGTEVTSLEDGTFNIVGLDAGAYTLKETSTPAGYNTCADIPVVISATHAETQAHDSATTTISMTANSKPAEINKVVNLSGTVLPETGGMGTTIFYTIGAVLMLASVVLLITKKRMSVNEE